MRENEFEKRVQQKMEDFNLHPSAEVWTEVERRIRKEKKRRFIFWWPLFFLLAGGGMAAGILFTNKKEKSETITADNNVEKPIQSAPEKINTSTPTTGDSKTIITNDVISKKDTTTITTGNDKKPQKPSDKTIISSKPGNKPAEKQITGIKKQKTTNESNSNNNENDKDIVTTVNPDKEKNDQPPVTTPVPSKQIDPVKDPVKSSDIAVVKKQEQIIQQKKPQPEPVQQKADSIVAQQKIKPEDKKSRKWDWGATFSAGRSNIVQGLRLSQPLLYASVAASQTSSPGNPFSNSLSEVRPSGSWAAGLYIKKAVSKKLDINIGFGYSYLSTKINVGDRVDSTRIINNYYSQGLSINNFYRSAGNSSYTNRFHFISLSGDISWRIITGKKVNIYWENGLSYNRLLGSGMLHYDRNLQGYYKDNSFLTKDHLSFTTGFSVPLSRRLQVNPFASYNLTPVLNSSDSLHFINYGIRIRFLINKK